MQGKEDIVTWGRFKELVQQTVESKATLFYRGQRDSNWKLRTSFHREAEQVRLTLLRYLDEIIPSIHYEITGEISHQFDLSDSLQFGAFLALLQHHGFPTPLLDWTLSPYIAAYFAFRDVEEKKPTSDYVKLFAFDCPGWAQTYQQQYNLRESTPYISVIRPFPRFNPRLVPQQGCFTVTNVDDMEAHLQACEAHAKRRFLWIARISVKEKIKVMRELAMMGITERSLFPGLDGCCRTMRSHFFMPEVVGPTPGDLLDAAMKDMIKAKRKVAGLGLSELLKSLPPLEEEMPLDLSKLPKGKTAAPLA